MCRFASTEVCRFCREKLGETDRRLIEVPVKINRRCGDFKRVFKDLPEKANVSKAERRGSLY
jgi:hypothetical protein